MGKKILFAWDFHGVLEKGNVYAVQELVNLVLKDFNINKEISLKETIEWYGLSWFDYFRLMTHEKDQRFLKKMVNRVLIIQQQNWETITKKHLKARDFAQEVLREILKQGHKNIILSNTQPKHIRTFAELININCYFDDIIGVDQHCKTRINKEVHKIKAETLKKFIKNKNFSKIIAIGDKESDIKAGRICGATTFLFIDEEIISEIKPSESDYVIKDLREILKIVKL